MLDAFCWVLVSLACGCAGYGLGRIDSAIKVEQMRQALFLQKIRQREANGERLRWVKEDTEA